MKLGVEIPTKGLKKFFYFHSEKLVSPVYHLARNWKRWESKHFQLWISDTSQFHPEANESVRISMVGDYYETEMRNHCALRPKDVGAKYTSVKCKEVLPNERSNGERYLFTADSNEVVVYDLFTNNSIAGYAAGFSLRPKTVPMMEGVYRFLVRRNVCTVVPNEYHIVVYRR